MFGYDVPEIRPVRNNLNKMAEIKSAKQSRNYLKNLIMKEHQLVYIKCKDFDKYGRLLGTILINKDDTKSVNQMMVDSKHGYTYDGSKTIFLGYTIHNDIGGSGNSC